MANTDALPPDNDDIPVPSATAGTVDPNPHSEQKPDFSLPGFTARRKRLTDRGMSHDDAVAFLSEEWDDEHASRLTCWDAARALPPATPATSTLPSSPGLGSNEPLPDSDGSSDPSRIAGTDTVPVQDNNPTRNTDQGAPGILISDDVPRPSDNLPTLANIVTVAMSNRSYIPLFYLTVEGRHAADREGLNSTNPLDGSKVSQSQLRNLRRDRELSISEIHEAGKVLVELMGQYNWGKDCERMFFSFFMQIDCHSYRNESGPNAVGPRALALYADRVRKRWHDDLNSNAGKPTYSIANIDPIELSNCHLQAQNEVFDLRVLVSVYSLCTSIPVFRPSPFFDRKFFPSLYYRSILSFVLVSMNISDSSFFRT